MITAQTLAASSVTTAGKALRHYHARVMTRRCEIHLDHSSGHDTTQHEARSEKGGGTTNERGDWRTEVERACMHAHARRS